MGSLGRVAALSGTGNIATAVPESKKNAPPKRGVRLLPWKLDYGFFDELVEVDEVPEVVVAVVAVVAVLEVSVIVPDGIADVSVLEVIVVPVADVSVVLIVPVVPVSVDMVVDEVELLSVIAVSVLTFSSFLQPTAKMATANRAMRVR